MGLVDSRRLFPVDDEERECKLVVLIEEVEIEGLKKKR